MGFRRQKAESPAIEQQFRKSDGKEVVGVGLGGRRG
jgi:hypothetical protein